MTAAARPMRRHHDQGGFDDVAGDRIAPQLRRATDDADVARSLAALRSAATATPLP